MGDRKATEVQNESLPFPFSIVPFNDCRLTRSESLDLPFFYITRCSFDSIHNFNSGVDLPYVGSRSSLSLRYICTSPSLQLDSGSDPHSTKAPVVYLMGKEGMGRICPPSLALVLPRVSLGLGLGPGVVVVV